jgi:predicted metal-dependent hydrolase
MIISRCKCGNNTVEMGNKKLGFRHNIKCSLILKVYYKTDQNNYYSQMICISDFHR